MHLIHLLQIVTCFVFSSLPDCAYGDVTFTTNIHDVVPDNPISEEIKLYVTKAVSSIAKINAHEIKELKALIELQARQMQALTEDKEALTFKIQTMEGRMEALNKKPFEVEGDKSGRKSESEVPLETEIIAETKFIDRASHDSHISTAIRQLKEQHNLIRRGAGTRVAFFARIKTTPQHVLLDQVVIFDDVMTNIGNAYNVSSGNFMAPVGGTYALTVTIGHESGDDTSANVVVNGNQVARVIVNEEQSTQSIIANLKAGDVVALQNAEIERDFTGNGYSSFSGFLLYEEVPASQIVG